MEFGDRNSFAIEFDLDEHYEGVWLFGKFSYWIKEVK
jgi:Immunity protein 42